MSFLIRTALILTICALVGPVAQAQSTMTIDGSCQFQLATSGSSVSINPANGNVTVSSQSGINCGQAGVTLTLPASAAVGTTFNVSWTSTGTSSCTPSGGGGSTWATQGTLPTSGTRTITAPGSPANNVAFTISCVTGGTPVTDTKTMNFTGGTASVNLVAPASVATGQSFTISWTSTGTSGATPCTPSGGGTTAWASQGALEPNGQRTITAPGTAGSATFTISCATGGTPVTDSETVNFTQTPGCTGVVPPPGINLGGIINWENIYNLAFPLPDNDQKFITINRGSARAIRIVAPSPGGSQLASGFLAYAAMQDESQGLGYVSISPCPYDFRESLNNATQRCLYGPRLDLTAPFFLGSGSQFNCNLTPGQTYYINLHAGSGSSPDATGAFCALSQCRWLGGARPGLQSVQEGEAD